MTPITFNNQGYGCPDLVINKPTSDVAGIGAGGLAAAGLQAEHSETPIPPC